MPKPTAAAHLCHACGGVIERPQKKTLRAAFGMELPEDEESTEDPFHEASSFEPEPYFYAKGGRARVPPADSDLGEKREVELPDYQLPVYRGETAKAKERQREAAEGDDEDGETSRSRLARADGYAEGGPVRAKLGSGKRFAHLTQQLAGRGDVKDPKALAAVIGRRELGSERMAKLAAAGRARAAERKAGGGEIERPSFAEHMARRLRVRHAMGMGR